MQPEQEPLSLSALLALASEQLLAAGYRVVRDMGISAFPGDRALLAEDAYGVLAVVGYETWAQLEAEWPDAQAELVELISRRLAKSTPKSYDGYLLLLCSSIAPDSSSVSTIERDTGRLRKIVATAASLKTTADLSRVLDPFLPLSVPSTAESVVDVLDALPDVLRASVKPSAVRVVVEAFRALEPPLERLHAAEEGL